MSIIVTNSPGNALALAAVFAQHLKDGHPEERWETVRAMQMNANAIGAGYSISHEWCDADEVMLAAFDTLGWASFMDKQFSRDGDHTAAWDGEPGKLQRRAWSLADGCAWDAPLLARAWLYWRGPERGDPADDAFAGTAALMREIAGYPPASGPYPHDGATVQP